MTVPAKALSPFRISTYQGIYEFIPTETVCVGGTEAPGWTIFRAPRVPVSTADRDPVLVGRVIPPGGPGLTSLQPLHATEVVADSDSGDTLHNAIWRLAAE